jgi:hypothetical protein
LSSIGERRQSLAHDWALGSGIGDDEDRLIAAVCSPVSQLYRAVTPSKRRRKAKAART